MDFEIFTHYAGSRPQLSQLQIFLLAVVHGGTWDSGHASFTKGFLLVDTWLSGGERLAKLIEIRATGGSSVLFSPFNGRFTVQLCAKLKITPGNSPDFR